MATAATLTPSSLRCIASQRPHARSRRLSARTSTLVRAVQSAEITKNGDSVVSAIDAVPITKQRKVPEGLDSKMQNPGQPRANITCDAEHPNGTYTPPEDMTVLQQHVAFWDPDFDGKIYPQDTYRGFRRLGFNVLVSAVAAPVIHGSLAYWTQKSSKHGSDSETFDTEGRFVPQKFEEIFSKYDKGNKGGLTKDEMMDMVRGNRNIMDFVGWAAAYLEWSFTFTLLAKDTPQGKLLLKDDARGCIDGTIFYKVEQESKSAKQQGAVVSSLDAVPITKQHRAPEGLDSKMQNPGQPRANITCDAEHPDGTYSPPEDMTVLQQHVAFWDQDADGKIWPLDTYRGFRRLGFNVLVSGLAVPVIHGTFAYWSGPSWIPDPRFIIHIANMHKTKHGSDSETFDTEGRFVPQKFEEIFSKYDKGNKGGLTISELNEMVLGNRNIMDPTGWIAEWLEWNVTYYLLAKETPKGKLLLKDDARGAIDGTIFFKVEKEVAAGRLKKKQLHGGLEKTRKAE
ncbi:putative peroxygenase 3 [Chlorella vulgaris]